MIDLAAERDASTDRREAADAEKWLAMRSRRLRTEGKDVSVEAARELWPGKSDEELAEVVDRARADIEERAMGKVSAAKWTGREIVRRGAELFRANPDANKAQVWEMLQAEAGGRTLCALSSWTTVHAPKARKLAGVKLPTGRPASRARKNGRGQGSGREDAARPSAVETATPASPGRTELYEPVAAPTPSNEVEKPARDLHTPADDSGLRDAATALLDSVESVGLSGLGGSWVSWLAEDPEALLCLRLRKALGMPLPEDEGLQELREVLAS